jgi:hypothetical protein
VVNLDPISAAIMVNISVVATAALIMGAAVIIAATTERAGTPQTVQTLSRASSGSKAREIFSLPADKPTRYGVLLKPRFRAL